MHLGELDTGVLELARRAQGGAGGDIAELLAASGVHRAVGHERVELTAVAAGPVQRDRALAQIGLEHFPLGGEVGALRVELGDVRDVLVDRSLRGVALLGGLLELIGSLVRGCLRGLDLGARSDHRRIGLDQILLRARSRCRESEEGGEEARDCDRAAHKPSHFDEHRNTLATRATRASRSVVPARAGARL